ncbi:MAG: O-antigen ligase family protein [Thiobacillus sp.]|jgi:O-antigen ligase|uniref:O-antigen ligase family protein n=1 Tax=Thiobacillus sp. TaxID=924 RepID=UPI0028947707|nr:O-antigen ligase family protein [Thiobacillus sp.]MDT3705251.1 O-antigen ligase family protein [Thiobacillus sp.]
MARSAKAYYVTWLIFSCFLLFPFKRLVELPILIMTIGGGVLAYKYRETFFRAPSVKFFTLLFLCIWLPVLISVPDSYDPQKSGSTALVFLRLYLAGLFVIWALSDQKQVQLLSRLLAVLAAVWVVDALFQTLSGHDLLGYAPVGPRINGVFGEDNPKLGNALPVLAPFLLLALRKNLVLMLLAALLTGAVVILAGSRGGWISYAVVCTWLVFSETRQRGVPLWKTGAVASLAVLIGAFAVFANPNAKQRLDQTLLLFSGDEAKIDQALSQRWTLWKVAFAMAEKHPVNGVGARAFRYAYPEFAKPDDPFISLEQASGRQTGAFYAHQIVMEVTTETGLIGLAGLGLFYWFFIRYWRRAEHESRLRALPFAMATMAWIFPFNTHPAFYSAHWSVMIWLVIAMFCATLLPYQKMNSGAS